MPANKSQDKSGDKGKTPATPATQNMNPPKSGQSGTPQNTLAPTMPSTPKLTSKLALKLGKDGRLTQGERQCCMDNNLCLFCGKPGHIAKECLKATSAAAKACAATAEKAPDNSSSAKEPKKLAATLWLRHQTRVVLTLSVPQ